MINVTELTPITEAAGAETGPWSGEHAGGVEWGAALCSQVDPELWFPEIGEWQKTHVAKAICAECPLQGPCLDWALMQDVRFGIWGGTTESDRRSLRPGRAKPKGEPSEPKRGRC